MLNNTKMPDSEKGLERLTDEANVIIGAGTATTTWALSVATYHFLTRPDVLLKLKLELEAALPDPDALNPLSTLEKLPYLTACIQECIRLSYGVSSRQQRIDPNSPMHFNDGKKDWIIPAGTPVGMTSTLIHHDESIFPDSYTYNPDRWLENPRLDRYLVSFSKGSRQCIGINLAYAELYLCVAGVFRRFGSRDVRRPGDEGWLDLWQTGLKDVAIHSSGFLPFPTPESKGVRVRVVRNEV